MKFTQDWQPEFNYCIICGKKCEGVVCNFSHSVKLEKLRSAIKERKEEEKAGAKGWDEKTIKEFRKTQDIIG